MHSIVKGILNVIRAIIFFISLVGIVGIVIGIVIGVFSVAPSENSDCPINKIMKNGECVSKITSVKSESEIQSTPKSQDKEKQTENEIHRLVNIEREKQGLMPLSIDPRLSVLAKSHSEDMLNNDYFSHVSLDGKNPTDRGISQGYQCRIDVSSTKYREGIGENIYKMKTTSITFWESPESIAKNTVSGWMSSPGHRANIMGEFSLREGIGVKIDTFNIYVTQNFC